MSPCNHSRSGPLAETLRMTAAMARQQRSASLLHRQKTFHSRQVRHSASRYPAEKVARQHRRPRAAASWMAGARAEAFLYLPRHHQVGGESDAAEKSDEYHFSWPETVSTCCQVSETAELTGPCTKRFRRQSCEASTSETKFRSRQSAQRCRRARWLNSAGKGVRLVDCMTAMRKTSL